MSSPFESPTSGGIRAAAIAALAAMSSPLAPPATPASDYSLPSLPAPVASPGGFYGFSPLPGYPAAPDSPVDYYGFSPLPAKPAVPDSPVDYYGFSPLPAKPAVPDSPVGRYSFSPLPAKPAVPDSPVDYYGFSPLPANPAVPDSPVDYYSPSPLPALPAVRGPPIGHFALPLPAYPVAPAIAVAPVAPTLVLPPLPAKATRQVQALASGVPVRLPICRPGRVATTARTTNIEAGYGQYIGDVNVIQCDHCARGAGVWTLCVSVPGKFGGACCNCHYGSEGRRCSFRGVFDPAEQGAARPFRSKRAAARVRSANRAALRRARGLKIEPASGQSSRFAELFRAMATTFVEEVVALEERERMSLARGDGSVDDDETIIDEKE